VCGGTWRCPKGHKVSWNVVRLDNIVNVVIIKISPTTKLKVQLVPVGFCTSAVPGDEREKSGGFEMRDIAHPEPVCSVSRLRVSSALPPTTVPDFPKCMQCVFPSTFAGSKKFLDPA
jgi:hypothetical protein